MAEGLMNRKLDWEEMQEVRKEVLTGWSTGAAVDLQEGIAYHKQLGEHKNFAMALSKAKAEGRTLTQPRAGVAVIADHITLLRHLETEGQADLLPTTIDSYTRQNKYQEAQRGIEESRREGRSLLNGFPAVNYGLEECRNVVESVNSPIQVRHGTPDARLLAEITLASGYTAYEGGGISYNIPYAKSVPLARSISDWQYVDRLVGYYEEQGVRINREPFGPLTGTLVSPCVSHTVAILEALLAAEQGVKSLTLGYGQCGNLMQDVAAIQTLSALAEEYLNKMGYFDCEVTTVFHQWMGGFPQEEARAFAVISLGAMAAAMAKATKVIVKTPQEAKGVPTKEANAKGLLATKQVLNMLIDQSYPETKELELEREIIKKETRAMINRSLELGEGDVALAAVRGFEAGTIDVPFAPSRMNAGKTMPARDNSGAVRFLSWGHLPFPADVQEFHKEKLAARGKSERRLPTFQMVVDDIYAIGKGVLVGRPK